MKLPWPKQRSPCGLSWDDYYPSSYIYKPSEAMLSFWKEHEKTQDETKKRTK